MFFLIQREVTVYVNKDGTVRDLLDEAATLVEFTYTIKKLRLVGEYDMMWYYTIQTSGDHPTQNSYCSSSISSC